MTSTKQACCLVDKVCCCSLRHTVTTLATLLSLGLIAYAVANIFYIDTTLKRPLLLASWDFFFRWWAVGIPRLCTIWYALCSYKISARWCAYVFWYGTLIVIELWHFGAIIWCIIETVHPSYDDYVNPF